MGNAPESAGSGKGAGGSRWSWVLAFAIGSIGALIAAAWLASASYELGPFRVRLDWSLAAAGSTRLVFPPLGEVIAPTHRAPTRITLELERVDLGELRALLARAEDESALWRPVVREGRDVLLRYLLRLATGALFGSVALYAFAASPLARLGRLSPGVALHRRRGFLFAASGATLLFLLMWGSYVTYDAAAFRRPVYRGAFASFPWVLDAVETGLARVEELDQRLRSLSRNVYAMYRRVESLQPPVVVSEADLVILHVTDIHNHPAAAGVVLEIARAFGADLVLNTGDLTDFGTAIETDLVRALGELEIPHLLVSGNHESPEAIQSLGAIRGLRLIDGRLVEERGLSILGIGDPGAATTSPAALSPSEAARTAEEVSSALRRMERRPDVVAVHNFRVGLGIAWGLVPLVAFGHSHTPGVTFRSGTAYVNGGTAGGAGLRGLENDEEVPISLAVIYLKKDAGATRVVAVDILTLSPVAGGFTLERHLAPQR